MLHSVRYKCTTGAQVLNCKICSSVTCLIVVTVTLFNLCPIFNFCTTLNPAISAPQMNFGVNRKRSTISNSSKILKKNRFSADYTLTLTFLVHSMLQVRFKFLAIKIPWLRIRVRRTYSYLSIKLWTGRTSEETCPPNPNVHSSHLLFFRCCLFNLR